MILNIPTNSHFEDTCPHMGLDKKGFLVGYLGSRISILVFSALIMYTNPKSRPQFAYDFILSTVVTIIGLFNFQNAIDRTIFYKVILPVEILLSVAFFGRYLRPIFLNFIGIKAEEYYVYPINVLVMQRRLCIFIMMVLGEGVIQILQPTLNQDHLIRCYSYAFAAIVLIFSFAMLYCDAALREHIDEHALRRSAIRGAIFIYAHSVCGFFMFLLGASLKLAYHDVVENHQIHNDVDSLTGVACGAIVLCILILRSTHKGIFVGKIDQGKPLRRALNYTGRSIFIVAHWIVAYRTFYNHDKEVYSRDKYLYFHAFITAASIIVEVCLSHFFPDADSKMKRHASHSNHPHHTTPYEERESIAQNNDDHHKKENDEESTVSKTDIQLLNMQEKNKVKGERDTIQNNNETDSTISIDTQDSSMCNPMQQFE